MRKVKRIVKYVECMADYGAGIRKDEKAWGQIDVYCVEGVERSNNQSSFEVGKTFYPRLSVYK